MPAERSPWTGAGPRYGVGANDREEPPGRPLTDGGEDEAGLDRSNDEVTEAGDSERRPLGAVVRGDDCLTRT